jgi:hypothetical protein
LVHQTKSGYLSYTAPAGHAIICITFPVSPKQAPDMRFCAASTTEGAST